MNEKILVIEDAEEVRKLIQETLILHGYTVYTADDGDTGLEQALQLRPNLILCDVQMPRMDGYDVLKALRKNPTAATTPFVFLTGVADRDHFRQGMNLGADDFLPKPFMLDELVAMVKARLNRKQQDITATDNALKTLRENIIMALPHELMTPLNGIVGYSSVLIQDHQVAKPHEILEYAQGIYKSAGRLQHLIENFLTYSQIELLANDPKKIATMRNIEPIDAREAIIAAARNCAHLANREVDLLIQVDDARISISQPYLQKIISELVDNAFKFSTPGSPVIVVSGKNGNQYRINIVDHGRGLTADQINSLGAQIQFDRRIYEQQGAGLGFTIARRLAELYSGSVQIESIPQQNTTVQLSHPEVLAY